MTDGGRAVLWGPGWWPPLVTVAASHLAPEHRAESPHHGGARPRLFICNEDRHAAKLLCTASFLFFLPVKFLAWLMEDGEEMHPSKTASLQTCRGLIPACSLGLGLTMLDIMCCDFFFSTLKFKNLMPDIFLSLTVLENWSHSAAVLGPALHSQ